MLPELHPKVLDVGVPVAQGPRLGVIEELSGKNVKLINPAYETAVSVKNYLTDKDMLNEKKDAGKTEFYVSDNPDKFSKVGEWLLKKPIENVVKIDL